MNGATMGNLSRRFQNDEVPEAGLERPVTRVEKKAAPVGRKVVERPAAVVSESAEVRRRLPAGGDAHDDGRVVRRMGGRPRLGESGKTLAVTKPWLEETPPVSRRTYFRHQAWIKKRALELYDRDGNTLEVCGLEASWRRDRPEVRDEYLAKARKELK
jgi:hypothetical protein